MITDALTITIVKRRAKTNSAMQIVGCVIVFCFNYGRSPSAGEVLVKVRQKCYSFQTDQVVSCSTIQESVLPNWFILLLCMQTYPDMCHGSLYSKCQFSVLFIFPFLTRKTF